MNERIKELIKVADYWASTFDDKSKYQEHLMNTFAELIVQECMNIAKQVEDDDFWWIGDEPDYRKGLNDGRRNAAWGIKNRIKQHFGVNE